jgi:uncharacterized membrane protein
MTRSDAPGARMAHHRGMTTLVDPRPFRLPAILLGIGLGGFFDGIVLHQVLQWHHMLSTPNPPTSLDALELNTLADGLFHLGTWVVTLIGVGVLWRAAFLNPRLPASSYLVGGVLAGWGGFNLIEGLVDHHLLDLHHVRPGPDQLLWDVAFLAWGAVMLIGGWWLMRRARARVATGGGLG